MGGGVDFKSLVLMMSAEKEDFPSYIKRMGANGCGVDASALHALGCRYRVDVLIWQSNVDPSIVGHSFSGRADEPLAMISVVMVNDMHFWGVSDSIEDTCSLRDHDLPERPPTFRVDKETFDDAHQRRLGEAPKRRTDDCVEAEIAVCRQLGAWNPWAAPSADLIHAL